MSTLKVDTLNGSTGSTITVPAGQTLSVAGTLTTTGTFNPTADVTVTGNISNDAITIADNTIAATRTNDNLILSAAGTGKVSISGLLYPTADGTANQVLKTDGSGNLSFTTISANAITEGNTNVTVTDSGTGSIVAAVDGNTELTITDEGVRVHGNLTVDGTQTVINTTTLSIEDNIIELNRNVSSNAGMPTYSGVKINRGSISTTTEQDLFWAWDESFAGTNGGAWTAFSSANDSGSAPTLVDVRANIVHAVATGAQYSDVAERYAIDQTADKGSIVALGGSKEITLAAGEEGGNFFGVISSQPAYMMNAGAGNDDTHPYVACVGRVPILVKGLATKGQAIVLSDERGVGKAVPKENVNPHKVVGRALADKNTTGTGLVECVVRINL